MKKLIALLVIFAFGLGSVIAQEAPKPAQGPTGEKKEKKHHHHHEHDHKDDHKDGKK